MDQAEQTICSARVGEGEDVLVRVVVAGGNREVAPRGRVAVEYYASSSCHVKCLRGIRADVVGGAIDDSLQVDGTTFVGFWVAADECEVAGFEVVVVRGVCVGERAVEDNVLQLISRADYT